jgi:hypothetical protein
MDKLTNILKAYYRRKMDLDDLPFNKADVKLKNELMGRINLDEDEFPIDFSLTKDADCSDYSKYEALIVTNYRIVLIKEHDIRILYFSDIVSIDYDREKHKNEGLKKENFKYLLFTMTIDEKISFNL